MNNALRRDASVKRRAVCRSTTSALHRTAATTDARQMSPFSPCQGEKVRMRGSVVWVGATAHAGLISRIRMQEACCSASKLSSWGAMRAQSAVA